MRRKDREIHEFEEIESIIRDTDVCHIAIHDEEYPYLVTLNFGYISGDIAKIYFHCALNGKKLDLIKKNNKVCFGFDTDHVLVNGDAACDYGMKFRSVIGYGEIAVVEDEKERLFGLNLIMKQYTSKDDFIIDKNILKHTLILRLDIKEMKGKQKK